MLKLITDERFYLTIILISFSISCYTSVIVKSDFHPRDVQLAEDGNIYPLSIKKAEENREFIISSDSDLGRLADDDLYALAGWLYITGVSPDAINKGHPPLAKYMIGLSELVFMNQNAVGLIVSLLTLFIVFLISKKTIEVFPFTLFPIIFLGLDKLYFRLSVTSLLEIYATFFAVLSIYLLFYSERKWATPLLFIAMGLALSCKWSTAFLLFIPFLYFLLNRNFKRIKFYPLYLIITIFTYMATYAVFFFSGKTLMDFFDLHYLMLTVHDPQNPSFLGFPALRILLYFLSGIMGPTKVTEIFYDPVGNIVTYTYLGEGLSLIREYNPLTWPLSFSASLMMLYYGIKKNRLILSIPLSFILYLSLLLIGKSHFWYLLPCMPFAFIALSYMISRIYLDSQNRKQLRIILGLYLSSVFIWTFVKLPSYIIT